MGLEYVDLDRDVRQAMVAEISKDIASESYYRSKVLTDAGHDAWPDLLRAAAASHDDDWLAEELQREGILLSDTTTKSGPKQVNIAAASARLAEGQFNRYYMQAICVVAMASGEDEVEIYRARESENPRSKSAELIGQRFPAIKILTNLRQSEGIETDFPLLAPNSGVSIRRIRQ
ncbi:MAG TPA: hypothetical protein VLF66_09900 [Thermoanaerobaculia bacterium]|nr:hypothetical protein [Thermoanaerobaculia bacterium]